MSVLAQLARAERIRGQEILAMTEALPVDMVEARAIIRSIGLAMIKAADQMEADVKKEFDREIADGGM